MFICKLCSDLDCAFCNYYKIENDTLLKTKYNKRIQQCDFCVYQIQIHAPLNPLIVKESTLDLKSVLQESSLQIKYETASLGGILSLKEELTPSPTLQNHGTETCKEQEDKKEALADNRGERTFKCNLCPYSTFREELLRKHKGSHIGTKKRFQCPTCPYAFYTRFKLVRHLFSHTGEAIFSCSVCSFSTAYRQSLKEHERRHTGEKPFRCSYCKQGFASSSDLLNHERRHKGTKLYKCRCCEYRCVTSQDLKVHERGRHLGIKPYACKYCSYRSAVSGHVARHQKGHRVIEKPN